MSTTSLASSSTSSGMSSASASASGSSTTFQLPSSLKVIGIVLAVLSGLLIGSSFVFKKKGLLRSQAGHAAGEGVAYLKSPLWWIGMTMMICGELCNFVAYAFVEALVVTPMGALSVVICAILSSIFLKEKLTFFGWLGCALCIIGSTIIALNGPQEQTPGEIEQFKKLFLAPGFLGYIAALFTIAFSIIFYFGPKYGKNSMLWYITVCSTIGGISVSVTTGLGAAIVTSVMGVNQFKNWFIYFLIAFVATTLLTEIYYLNIALALFNTAMVTPTYYVLFSFFSMVTTIVLFQGLSAPVSQILTLVLAFLTICVGITILQMSKIDPAQLSKLDRRSTMLLEAARAKTEDAEEKGIAGMEDPGIEALRGSFGTMSSIIRARSARRVSQSSRHTASTLRGRSDGLPSTHWQQQDANHAYDGLTRHQLYDAPVPRVSDPDRASSFSSRSTTPYSPRKTAIKFGSQDLVHSYRPPGSGDADAIHEHRNVVHSTPPVQTDDSFVYPPPPNNDVSSTPGGSQSLTIPPRANDEPPAPTVSTMYHGPTISDPFDTPTTPTMTAFPSSSDLLTDKYPPQNYDSQEDVRPAERTRRSSSTGQSRRYPRGVDDAEESISLWERTSPVHEMYEQEEPSPPVQGIRLVKPSSKTWL
ncbi:magnesium transporter NIPA-domain-containing protein [Suillus paluster]|uniref:magnesium transporter NIPA-domain-containing protein n=1 Tax=Suillus paluster TaxID=48578 RepID=UPI001B8872CA|nr:magnesium transporter NIPA-domain-containing protein [Suillus paluster]KAG1751291.1 magnesium transporter NIPA-domain-containing protein [Suillus paluster]